MTSSTGIRPSCQARADLHSTYGTAPVGWVPWVWPRSTGRHRETSSTSVADRAGSGSRGEGRPPRRSAAHPDRSAPRHGRGGRRTGPGPSFPSRRGRGPGGRCPGAPFDDGAFDVVIANHMLYHVPAPQRAVAEFARVLRPDGLLMAATNGPRHLRQLWEVRALVFGGPPTSAHPEISVAVTGAAILRRASPGCGGVTTRTPCVHRSRRRRRLPHLGPPGRRRLPRPAGGSPPDGPGPVRRRWWCVHHRQGDGGPPGAPPSSPPTGEDRPVTEVAAYHGVDGH